MRKADQRDVCQNCKITSRQCNISEDLERHLEELATKSATVLEFPDNQAIVPLNTFAVRTASVALPCFSVPEPHGARASNPDNTSYHQDLPTDESRKKSASTLSTVLRSTLVSTEKTLDKSPPLLAQKRKDIAFEVHNAKKRQHISSSATLVAHEPFSKTPATTSHTVEGKPATLASLNLSLSRLPSSYESVNRCKSQ